jgi:hypothetical protein
VLAKIKLWIIGFFTVLSAVLLGFLKLRSSQLEAEKEKNKILEENEALQQRKEKADEEVLTSYWEGKEEVVEDYESKFKQAKNLSSRPLDPSSLELLNRSNED